MKKVFSAFVVLALLAAQAGGQSIENARKNIDAERYEAAKTELNDLIKTPASSAEAYYYLGEVYLKTLEQDSAKYYFDKGVSANSKFPLNYAGQGEIAVIQNNIVQAKDLFEKAISLSAKTKDFRPYIVAANANAFLMAVNGTADYAAALNYLEQAQKVAPKSPEVYKAMGDVYLAQKNAGKAIENYNKAQEIDKRYLPAYIGQSQIYRGARNYQASLAPLNEAVQIDPNYAPAYREMAELYISSGQYEKAMEIYKDKYMQLTDASCNSSTRYASVLFLARQYSQSYTQIKLLMANCELKPVLYRLLGYSAYELKKYDEAQQAMTIFFEKQNSNNIIASDYEYMAKILDARGNQQETVAFWEKAIQKNPSKTELYPMLGKAAYLAKMFDKAVVTYETYFDFSQVKATSTDYLYYGLSAMRLEQYKKANDAFLKVTIMSPTYIQVYDYLGEVNVLIDPENKQHLAKPYYEKVIELGEVAPEKNAKYLITAYRYMGDYVYTVENNSTLAKSYFNKILVLSPDDAQAQAVINGLEANK